jgi:hypothetical protein
VTIVLKLAALVLAAASTASPPALVSSSPWWEKVTVTVASDGTAQSCSYQSSLLQTKAKSCEVSGTATALASDEVGGNGEYTRITFERRFSLDAQQGHSDVHPGETLLGGQVMALAIDAAGSVKTCKIVATSGDMTPDYGCDEAAAERFEASAGRHTASSREGYMTVLVYGHAEHVV